MDKDGTGMNFDFDILQFLPKNNPKPLIFSGGADNPKPLIFSGGAGNYHHLQEGLTKDEIDAVSTANLLNFVGEGLINARKVMLRNDLPLAKWS